MLYYIDGYNLMFRAFGGQGILKDYRENLIEQLNEMIQATNMDATIVFDAQYQFGSRSKSHYRHLTVCFTNHGETADDYLIDEISTSKTPRQIILVTSDKSLALRARHYHSQTISVETFMSTLSSQFKKKRSEVKENKIITPSPPESATPKVQEESFHYYLLEFEKRFKETTGQAPIKKKYLTDNERWLDLFEKRMEDHE